MTEDVKVFGHWHMLPMHLKDKIEASKGTLLHKFTGNEPLKQISAIRATFLWAIILKGG